MNYNKIYNQLIERAQNRTLEGYKEKHHIIPKCLGGSNGKENLVELTAREHFLCHRLLCEIYPNEAKLKYALFLMAIGKRKYKSNHHIISSRVYELLKLDHSLFLTGGHHTEETKKKISKSNLGKTRSEEIKIKMSNSRKGHPMYTNEWRQKIKIANTGKIRTDEYKRKFSEYMKKKERTKEWNQNISNNRHKLIEVKSIPIIQYNLEGEFIREWNSMTEASKSLNRPPSSLSECCSGIRKQAYGYIWKNKIS